MRILRDVQPVAKVTLAFLLSLCIAAILTLVSPRAAHAEGFLLPTVRCLVQTLLVNGCKPVESPAQTPVQPPAQQNPAPVNSQSQQSSPSSKQQTTAQNASPEPYFEPIVDTEVSSLPSIEEVPKRPLSKASHIDESEYLAYYNTYSKYAVESAQNTSSGKGIVQTSARGWMIAGIAWYWWAIGLAAVSSLIFYKRKQIFSIVSILRRRE